jgi:hypothetical protein
VRGALPEAGRLQGMVLSISPRNDNLGLGSGQTTSEAAIAPHPEAVRVQFRMSSDVADISN